MDNENTLITAPFILNSMQIVSQTATEPRGLPVFQASLLPPSLLSQCDELIDFTVLRHPEFLPSPLRDWSLHIIRLSSAETPAPKVIHKPATVSKANHAYDYFLSHRNVRCSSCHYMKWPSSLLPMHFLLFPLEFPSLSLLVYGSKNLTCHEAWTQARRAACLTASQSTTASSPHTSRKHRLSLESLTNDFFTKLWAVNGLSQVVRKVKSPPAHAG